jgi:hypothetical protein
MCYDKPKEWDTVINLYLSNKQWSQHWNKTQYRPIAGYAQSQYETVGQCCIKADDMSDVKDHEISSGL